MTAERPAPAKVNLFLHVGRREPDGFHPLASWAAFADVADRLRLEPAAAWSFAVEGPFAADIGPGENLVEQAVRALAARTGQSPPAARLTLETRLPVAAGLGGGTSDATAALRLVNSALQTPAPEAVLAEIAAALGSDGPICFRGLPALMQGRGERLSPAPRTPALPVVLANPGTPASTRAVYAAYDEGRPGGADLPELPSAFGSVEAAAQFLAICRNDLEASAIRIAPAVAGALALLRGAPETLLARMSGSGATVFALCAHSVAARALAARVASARPFWWVAAGSLAGQITNS